MMVQWHISKKILLWKDFLSHKKGWNSQHPATVNNGSKKWRIVSSYLQLSWQHHCMKLSNFVLCINHIIFLQETWLAKQTLDKLTDISDNHFACGKAEVDYTKGITSGRLYSGTAILWNKKLNAKIFMNQDQRIIGLEVCLDSSSLNFLNVYMPGSCHIAVTPTTMST